jgi:hypothetical protein
MLSMALKSHIGKAYGAAGGYWLVNGLIAAGLLPHSGTGCARQAR